MIRFGRVILLPVVVAGSVLGLPACKKSSTTPTPVATPTPPAVRGVLGSLSFDRFETGYVAVPLPLSQGGILDVTVDWTFPDSWIFVYIARGTCTTYAQLTGKTCSYIVSSETQFPKPRVVVTPPIPAGTYTLVIYNVPSTQANRKLGIGTENVESVSFLIGLTVGGAATPQTAAAITLKPVVIQR